MTLDNTLLFELDDTDATLAEYEQQFVDQFGDWSDDDWYQWIDDAGFMEQYRIKHLSWEDYFPWDQDQ